MNWMTHDDSQEIEEPRSGQPAGGADETEHEESPATMTLSGIARPEGLPGADEFGDVDESNSRQNLVSNAGLGLVIVAIAGVALLLMRASHGTLEASASQATVAKIDTAIARLSNPQSLSQDSTLRPSVRQAVFRDTDSIVSMFESDPTDRQVPLQFTKKNPFQRIKPEPEDPAQSEAGDDRSEEIAAQQREAELEALRAEAEALDLQSVLGGERAVAVIDGEFYRPGENVGSFEVAQISRFTVDLAAADETFTLSLDQ